MLYNLLKNLIHRKALKEVETDALEHRSVVIPAVDWEKFEAWAASPAKDVPALRKLAAIRPAWQCK